jgi:hypothetical protein
MYINKNRRLEHIRFAFHCLWHRNFKCLTHGDVILKCDHTNDNVTQCNDAIWWRHIVVWRHVIITSHTYNVSYIPYRSHANVTRVLMSNGDVTVTARLVSKYTFYADVIGFWRHWFLTSRKDNLPVGTHVTSDQSVFVTVCAAECTELLHEIVPTLWLFTAVTDCTWKVLISSAVRARCVTI